MYAGRSSNNNNNKLAIPLGIAGGFLALLVIVLLLVIGVKYAKRKNKTRRKINSFCSQTNANSFCLWRYMFKGHCEIPRVIKEMDTGSLVPCVAV